MSEFGRAGEKQSREYGTFERVKVAVGLLPRLCPPRERLDPVWFVPQRLGAVRHGFVPFGLKNAEIRGVSMMRYDCSKDMGVRDEMKASRDLETKRRCTHRPEFRD